jgi:nitrogen fixation NifU-like protein
MIQDISFFGEGCAISKASASLLCSLLYGKPIHEANILFDDFHKLLTKQLNPQTDPHQLGKLEVFSHIWKYPSRVKCAGLIWHTLHNAIEGDHNITKTE